MGKMFKIGLLLLVIGFLLCFYSLYPLEEYNQYHIEGGNMMTFDTSKSILYLLNKDNRLKLNPETDKRKRIYKYENKTDIIKRNNRDN